MASQIIKIGTKVSYRKRGENKLVETTVESIERCKYGEKYGTPVSSVFFDKRSGCGCDYVFTLDCGNWCYGEQIIKIVN